MVDPGGGRRRLEGLQAGDVGELGLRIFCILLIEYSPEVWSACRLQGR